MQETSSFLYLESELLTLENLVQRGRSEEEVQNTILRLNGLMCNIQEAERRSYKQRITQMLSNTKYSQLVEKSTE